MKPFTYEEATDVASAVALLSRPQTKALAGGTNLVDLLRLGVEAPETVVDITRLGLDEIEDREEGGLRIGAGVTNSDLAGHPAVRRRFPALTRAIVSGASGQLRNAATVGGNLLQRTRCLYFNDITKPCNKRVPGTGCPARGGISRDLAVIGGSEACIATNPSDMAVALAALDATIHVQTTTGAIEMTVEEFFRLPGDDPARDTNLPDGGLITAVELPPPLSERSTYRKARDRASYAFALGSVAAVLDLVDGEVRDLRLAFGAIAHRPWRARVAENDLVGRSFDADRVRQAVGFELATADPQPDNAFKIELVTRLTVDVLSELAATP